MTVINKDYQKLEEQIQELKTKWSNLLEEKSLADLENISSFTQFPAIPQLALQVDFEQYKSFILELATLLKNAQPALEDELQKIEKVISEIDLEKWFKKGIKVNDQFFVEEAKELNVAPWIPQFLAEHALRPFLKKTAEELKDVLKDTKITGCCPACGEAPRLATLTQKGKKELICPRCEFTWELKKIQCAHCGTDDHSQLEIIKIEKNDSTEIHVCNSCKGYTKVIDTRQLLKQDSPAIMDIKSIHLDFIAQEKGYGVSDNPEGH